MTDPGSRAIWPSRREDGTLSVGARFSFTTPETRAIVEAIVAACPQTQESDSLDVHHELIHPPYITEPEPGQLEIVCDARARSRLWKDILVHLVGQIEKDTDAQLIGFYDHVADKLRSALRTQEEDDREAGDRA